MIIPADIPESKHAEFSQNYQAITRGTDRLMLFAGDHKIEHLEKDFYGPKIHTQAHHPEYLFYLASQAPLGAFATQMGLIARYARNYKNINYIVKLNSKTNIIPPGQKDPISTQLWTVADIVKFKHDSQLPVCGVGYTIYLGSEHEHTMLAQAAQIVYHAHQAGLVAILWMYPRGKHISDERDGLIIAGAAGVANCLGADFAKINVPEATETKTSAELLKIATEAAGNTKLICSGGSTVDSTIFIQELYTQLTHGNTGGSATGRNIYQRPAAEALALTRAIAALVYENTDLQTALNILQDKRNKIKH